MPVTASDTDTDQQPVIVIKYGGSLMEQPVNQKDFCDDIQWLCNQGYAPVLVHGGGKALSDWMRRIGLTPVFVEGFRYTDQQTAILCDMVLSGYTNGELVDKLNQSGVMAVGISGKDGRLLSVQKMASPSGQDLGFVGEVTHVNGDLIRALIDQGIVPVISSVSSDASGQTFNLNADTVAQAVACSLFASHLVFLTDVNRLILSGVERDMIDESELIQVCDHPDVSGGMIPKLRACRLALSCGVSQVDILNGCLSHGIRTVFDPLPMGTRFIKEKQS